MTFRLHFDGGGSHVVGLPLSLRHTKRNALDRALCAIALALSLSIAGFAQAPVNVLQPGDPIIASSLNSPATEAVEKAIDGTTAAFLIFDTRLPDLKPSGFVVSPSIGPTVITGMAIQSAVDAPDRDPKAVTLEGSNDEAVTNFFSGNWELIKPFDVPPFTDRLQIQTFLFSNSKSYLHYRWTVTQTQVPNSCCMQVAEVALLSVINTADCARARFVLQPVDQPVLEGKSAIFTVALNGPWPLQWLKNGQPIVGATGKSFTTEPVTAETATNVYAVRIVDCETSDNVQAVIFTPASAKSIGINFSGWIAGGLPMLMQPEDIAGVQLQANWNNAPDPAANVGSGSLPAGHPLLDSFGNSSSITFSWDAGAAGSSEVGTNTATGRFLNGLVGATDMRTNTFTFSNVPAGSHSVIVYALAPPLAYQNISYAIGTNTYFMRTMTSDEYKRAPGYYRSFSTNLCCVEVGDFVRFDGVQPDADGKITLSESIVWVPANIPNGVNAVQLILNSGPPQSPPAINIDPQPTFVAAGRLARLTVVAAGEGLTYQWRKDGRNIPNGANVSGATSPVLTINNCSFADEGIYNVAVFNAYGSAISRNATLNISALDIMDRLVAYWKFDESSGQSVSNSVPGGFPGGIKNSLGKDADGTFAPGQVSNALDLDGQHYVIVTNYTKAKAAMSGAAWVNMSLNAATSGNDVAIFRNAEGYLTIGGGFRVVGQFEVGLAFDPNDSAWHPMAAIGLGPVIARVIGAASVGGGAWRHVAFTADGAQLRLYLDGMAAGVVDYQGQINPPEINYISMGAMLSRSNFFDPQSLVPDVNTPRWLIGQLDDVALWTRALSPSEMWLVYNAGRKHAALTNVSLVTAPIAPLVVTRTADGVTLTFDGGKLQSSLNIGGPWSDVTNATSPHSEPIGAAGRFFRTVAE